MKLSISSYSKIPEFEIYTNDHFWRLITLDKTIWKIKYSDENFINFLIKILDSNGLTNIANTTTFEPNIKGYTKEDLYVINAKFYLGFENKEISLLPMINFYKNIIDFLQN